MINRDKIIIKLRDFDDVNDLIKDNGGILYQILPYIEYLEVDISNEVNKDIVLENYKTDPRVASADFETLAVTASYSTTTSEGGGATGKILYCHHIFRTGVLHAHQYTTGSGSKVCIGDQGVTQHEDLKTVSVGYAPFLDPPDDFTCWEEDNYYDHSLVEAIPYADHGTDCAGLTSCLKNNTTGYVGICPDANLYVVSANTDSVTKGCGHTGYVGIQYQLEGARYMLDTHGVRVFNWSWGSYADNPTYNSTISGLLDDGAIIINAAGNDGYDSDDENNYWWPVKAHPRMICTSASMHNSDNIRTYDNVNGIVNYGARVDTVVPTGIGLIRGSPFYDAECGSYTKDGYHDPDDTTTNYTASDGNVGTSFAGPQTAGHAALCLSIDSTFTAAEVKTLIRNNFTKPQGTNFYTYYPSDIGIADAGKIVKAALVAATDYDNTIYPHITFYGSGVAYGMSGTQMQQTLDGTVYADITGYAGELVTEVTLKIGTETIYQGDPAILALSATSAGSPETVTIRATTASGYTEESYTDIIVDTLSLTSVIETFPQEGQLYSSAGLIQILQDSAGTSVTLKDTNGVVI